MTFLLPPAIHNFAMFINKNETEHRRGAIVPKLEHPAQGGWNHHQIGQDASGSPPAGHHLRADNNPKHDLPPRAKDPGPGGGGGWHDSGGDEGGGTASAGTGSAEWLQKHSFRAREGSFVSVKESLDHSQEVRSDRSDRLEVGGAWGMGLGGGCTCR